MTRVSPLSSPVPSPRRPPRQPSPQRTKPFSYRGTSSERSGESFVDRDGRMYIKLFAPASTKNTCRHCFLTCRVMWRECTANPQGHGDANVSKRHVHAGRPKEGRTKARPDEGREYDVSDGCEPMGMGGLPSSRWRRRGDPQVPPVPRGQDMVRSLSRHSFVSVDADEERRREETASTLHLSGVPSYVTRSDVHESLARQLGRGGICDVRLPRDYDTGARRTFGFVEYFNQDHVWRVMRGRDRLTVAIGGTKISAQRARFSRSTPEEMHRRNAHRRATLAKMRLR
ncbi:Aste57867_1731 [Aphanomyces stellatus]|uniref:Aste57867_1731 protein n=1 Tax=Aphanomyces stellatus TaxID=120398 RepID=A0A485K6E1_9STRA|nr:hypothetical protein As57867_001729 [Aphanomyces stellatus]VFT78942.1 Aste57867_1731 [Aphanomyces stellatus]